MTDRKYAGVIIIALKIFVVHLIVVLKLQEGSWGCASSSHQQQRANCLAHRPQTLAVEVV
jgi:hypothetical protein